MRHYGITNSGEAIGYGPGTCSPFEIIHGAEGQGEGIAAELVIKQYAAEVTGSHIAKAEGSPCRIA